MNRAYRHIIQIGAVALSVLAVSLAWRTGIQKALVCPDSMRDAIYSACSKTDGCKNLYATHYRYSESMRIWIPILRVSLTKEGRGRQDEVVRSLKRAMETQAEKGSFLLREARRSMEVQFVQEQVQK